MFLNHFALYGVGCHKPNHRPNQPILSWMVEQNRNTMIYPCHLNVSEEMKKPYASLTHSRRFQIDQENHLWLITNNVPRFFFARLDPNVVNFRVFRAKVADAIKSGRCSS